MKYEVIFKVLAVLVSLIVSAIFIVICNMLGFLHGGGIVVLLVLCFIIRSIWKAFAALGKEKDRKAKGEASSNDTVNESNAKSSCNEESEVSCVDNEEDESNNINSVEDIDSNPEHIIIKQEVEPKEDKKIAETREKSEREANICSQLEDNSNAEKTTMQEKSCFSDNPFKSKVFSIIFCFSLVVLLPLSIVLIDLSNETYPEYVQSLRAKVHYHNGWANNSLCSELVKKAEDAHEKGLYELEETYFKQAATIKTSDVDLALEIAQYFNRTNDDTELALTILKQIHHPERADVLAEESYAYFLLGAKDCDARLDTAIQLGQNDFCRFRLTRKCCFYTERVDSIS